MGRRQIFLPHLTEEETETQERPRASFKLSWWDGWGQKLGLLFWVKGTFPLLHDALLRIFSQEAHQDKSIFGFPERPTYQT